jgi:surface antigen
MLHIFRNYSALIVVISSAILVSGTNLAAGRESSGFLFGYLGSSEDNYDNPLENKIFAKSSKKNCLALAPLAEATASPDPDARNTVLEEDETSITQGQSVVAETCPVKKDPEEDGGVIVYEVKEGDTVSTIAQAHKVSANTILWANELDSVDSIAIGDKIFILPVSGLSYTVRKGDSIDYIAQKYKAEKDKIIAFNELPADGELQEGQEIMIPDGQKEIPQTQTRTPGTVIATRPYESFQAAGKSTLSGKAGAGHKFPYGYCTWYVASRRNVPWGGNAGTWLYHAKAAGYATGRTPKAGAIMVSSESWWGHVAVVESVSGNSFTVSEMNYAGFAKKSSRTLDKNSRVIKGFIY